MEIQRNTYLQRLVERRHNGFIKVITGIRRCGKSFLLFNQFKRHLLEDGIKPSQIIEIALDEQRFESLRDPIALGEHLRSRIRGKGWKYVFIDEIQMCRKVLSPGVKLKRIAPEDRKSAYITFYDVLNELMHIPNVDVYVTGSNSRMLSSDIASNFGDRGDDVRLHPLGFSEFLAGSGLEKGEAWEQYLLWGGMPVILQKGTDDARRSYLQSLFREVYFTDIVKRHRLSSGDLLENVADVLFSSVGSLSNPTKIANTISSGQGHSTTQPTVSKYIAYLEDAFLVKGVKRYDVKGREYLDSPLKYYAEDIGLRNARLNFRQIEETHLMENVIYNELIARGCSVDVGVVPIVRRIDGQMTHRQHEIDFVVNHGLKKIYVQSAFAIPDEDKRAQETLPLLNTGDFFRKIVVTSGFRPATSDEQGIVYVGIIPFLLDSSILLG